MLDDVDGQVRAGQPGAQIFAELRRPLVQHPPAVGRFHLVQRREASPHADRIRAQRAGLIHGADRRDQLHQIGAAGVGGDRKPAADHFAVRDEIGAQAKLGRHPAAADAEAADDFVENHQRAARPAAFDDTRDPLGALRQQSVVRRQRLDDHGGDGVSRFVEQPIERRLVIERRHERVGENAVRHAGARRRHASRQPAAGLDEHGVGVAVIAAFEFQNPRPSGRRARDAQRGHHRFGARGDEADALDPGQALGDPFCELSEYGSHAPNDQPSFTAS